MSALIIIDIQNDFINGSLQVQDGESIIPKINQLKKDKRFKLVILSQDSHPKNHISFASNNNKKVFSEVDLRYKENGKNLSYKQIMWPDHCVKNSYGEEFHEKMEISDSDIIVKKGQNNLIDSYSVFYDNLQLNKTDLDDILKNNNIKDIFICGIAFDYCVKFTALDAIKLGYNVNLYKNLTKSVNVELDKENIRIMEEQNINILYFLIFKIF